MKAPILLVIVMVAACDRQHTCECVKTRANGNLDTGHPEIKVLNGSRASAESSCTSLETEGSDEQGPYSKTCRLKE